MYFVVKHIDYVFKLLFGKAVVVTLYAAVIDICIIKNIDELFKNFFRRVSVCVHSKAFCVFERRHRVFKLYLGIENIIRHNSLKRRFRPDNINKLHL